jgi:uncharacterized protein with HEPN domain
MNDKDATIIEEIFSEIQFIEIFLEGFNEEKFFKDTRTQRAVCMTLINIGELVKRISDGFKKKHPDIPWKSISGLRDITAHQYQTLLMEDVWKTVTMDVPELKESLERMLFIDIE